MKSGFFLPFSGNYKLFWIWGIILLSFERIIFYELDKHGNWFLTLIMLISYAIFIVLIWPHRFFIAEDRLYFPTFPRLKMRNFELKYVTGVCSTRTGISFSYAGKRYQFLTFGNSKGLLEQIKEMTHEELLQTKL